MIAFDAVHVLPDGRVELCFKDARVRIEAAEAEAMARAFHQVADQLGNLAKRARAHREAHRREGVT